MTDTLHLSAGPELADNREQENTGKTGRRKRGRIPQDAWPRILARQQRGDTLGEIAREFGCTPSAVSYVIKKAESAGIEPDLRQAGPINNGYTAHVDDSAKPAAAESQADKEPTDNDQADQRVSEVPQKPRAETTAAQAPVPDPVDEIEARLREITSEAAVTYRAWHSEPTEANAEALSALMHKMRRVLARLDINMAASVQKTHQPKHIQPPQHRSARQQR